MTFGDIQKYLAEIMTDLDCHLTEEQFQALTEAVNHFGKLK